MILSAFKTEFYWVAGTALVLALMYGGYKLYHIGYDNAMATVDRESKLATDAAVEAARKEWVSSQELTKQGAENVQAQKEKIIYITKQADTIVAPKCTDLGVGYSGVYNQYIDTIQGNPNPN